MSKRPHMHSNYSDCLETTLLSLPGDFYFHTPNST
jgi:hypothetical protein